MGIKENIKTKLGKVALAKDLKKLKDRKAGVCDFNNADSIAFLYQVYNKEQLAQLLKVGQYFKNEFGIKRVFALGYNNEKKTPEYLKSTVNFDFVTNNDQNWKGIPFGTTYDNFISEEFNILIDLRTDSDLLLDFALLHSKSKFKIGRFAEDKVAYYDLMIHFQEDNLEEYINQVVHYLNMINPI